MDRVITQTDHTMKAVVYQGPYEVAVEEVEDPELKHPNDVIVDITTSCICGSDLHMYEGRTAAEEGIVFGHENMGIVSEVGEAVSTLEAGDRAVAFRVDKATEKTAPGKTG